METCGVAINMLSWAELYAKASGHVNYYIGHQTRMCTIYTVLALLRAM